MTSSFYQQKYYQLGSLFGLAMALVVGFLILQGSLIEFFSNLGIGVSILGGALSCLCFAWFFDERRKSLHNELSFRSTQFVAFKIFLIGACTGSFLNFILQGRIFSPPLGLYAEFVAWFVRPIFWLGLIGSPLSILTAVIYSRAMKFLVGI